MLVLVTGAAGFIGSHVSKELCDRGDTVIGIDNINDYYDVELKKMRLQNLANEANFVFLKVNVADREAVNRLFLEYTFESVVHLAAQAGVRYSIENPHAYADSNLIGFLNILEGCRHYSINHLVYGSSSSVYGANKVVPFSENHNVDHPVSFYAATKKANESMAHSYSHLFGLPTTGLRFFTVYGPFGRPDMSPFIFADAINRGKPIDIFNFGDHKRDFTYIDDVVQAVLKTLDNPAAQNTDWSGLDPDSATSEAPWRLYNVGNSRPVQLLYFIECLEREFSKKAIKNFLPMQAGDVKDTYADTSAISLNCGYSSTVSIEEGVSRFASWYLEYISD